MSKPHIAWAEHAIQAHWAELEHGLGSHGMPIRNPKNTGYACLGFGSYGVVFSTQRSDVALKITSDPAEIAFVTEILSVEDTQPVGMVRYYKALRLPVLRLGRPVAAIWREAALRTGSYLTSVDDFQILRGRSTDQRAIADSQSSPSDDLLRAAAEFDKHLAWWCLAGVQVRGVSRRDPRRFRAAAKNVIANGEDFSIFCRRSYGWRLAPGLARWSFEQRTAYLLGTMKALALLMATLRLSKAVGGALATYFDRGIVLCDVHADNVGQVERGDGPLTVITDPGHAVFLDAARRPGVPGREPP